MPDLKLPELLGIAYPRINDAKKREPNAQIQKVAERFCDNIRNVKSIPAGFLSFVAIAVRYEAAAVEVAMEKKGQKNFTDDEIADPEYKRATDKLLHRKVDDFEKLLHSDDKAAEKEDERILKNIQFVLDVYGQDDPENEHIRHIRSMFKAMITGTWTAFEVMAGDLWEAALNVHPSHLAELPERNDDRSRISAETRKMLDLETLLKFCRKHKYNLSGVMGSVYRDAERFNFSSLKSARKAYKAAFRDDHDDVIKAIEDTSLDALASVRNAIVHSGAHTDEDFLSKANQYEGLKKWKGLDSGAKIDINGEDVRELVVPVINTGRMLLTAVDHWILDHQ